MAANELEDLFEPKTKKWNDSEYVIVNGVSCCYTFIKDQGYLVHLPGGKSKYAHDLMFSGYVVFVPYKVRGKR
jgi:hypothetical protein